MPSSHLECALRLRISIFARGEGSPYSVYPGSWPAAALQVAGAHDKLRERDATGCFELLFALCFLFKPVESQATQR
jgi:hypothetical protein